MVKKSRILIAVLVVVVIAVGYFVYTYFQRPLTDEQCAQYLDVKISSVESGRSNTVFSTNSGLYPTVTANVESAKCLKRVSVVLVDENGKDIKELAYNLPPITQIGGSTGYGDYNEYRNLSAGNYMFEFYYGDLLFEKINIKIE